MSSTHPSGSRTTRLVSALIALGVSACAHGAPAQRIQAEGLSLEARPLLAVSAAAERLVPADTATIELAIEYVADTPEVAGREVSSRASALSQELGSLRPGVNLAVEELSVKPVLGHGSHGLPLTARPLAHAGRVEITIPDLPATDAESVFRQALAHGATLGSVTYGRRACEEVLGELRVEAVARAHARAQSLAPQAHTRVGSLFRLKEASAECPVQTSNPLRVHLRPAPDGSRNPRALRLPAITADTAVPLLVARVEALLVYELIPPSEAPAGEGPGEVHLGLARRADVETSAVLANTEVRVRVAAQEASDASARAASVMSQLITQLRSAGMEQSELTRAGMRVGTRIEEEETPRVGRAPFRVLDYVAESRIEITTRRVAELGRWLALAAQHGATGLSGPNFEVATREPLVDAALKASLARAMQDIEALARAGGQRPRGVTQIRINEGWLSASDPLQLFIQEFGRYNGEGSGYGRGSGGFKDDVVELDTGFPVLDIRAPQLRVSAEAAIGVALQSAR